MAGISHQALLAAYAAVVNIGTPVSIGKATASGGASTRSMTTTATVPTGAVIIVMGGCGGVNANSVADGTNTYTALVSNAQSVRLRFFYTATPLAAPLSSGATITLTFSGTTVNEDFVAAFYVTGLMSSSNDATADAQAAASGTTPTVTSGTLAQAKSIVIGGTFGYFVNGTGSGTITQPSGFAMIDQTTNFGIDNCAFSMAYKIVSATTAQTYNPTFAASMGSTGCISIEPFKGV